MMAISPGKKRYFTPSNPTYWHLYDEVKVQDTTDTVKIQALTECYADKKRLLTRGIKPKCRRSLSGPNKKTFPSGLPQAPPSAHARFKGAFPWMFGCIKSST